MQRLICNGYFIKLDERNDISLSTTTLKPSTRKKIPVSSDIKAISPVSGNPMLVFKYRGIRIDYCDVSNSVWLDNGEFEKVISKNGKKDKPASSAMIPGVEAGFLANSGNVFGFLGDAILEVFGNV